MAPKKKPSRATSTIEASMQTSGLSKEKTSKTVTASRESVVKKGKKKKSKKTREDDSSSQKSGKTAKKSPSTADAGCSKKLKQIKNFVDTTLTKGVSGLQAEFRSMKRTNDWSLMKEFVAQNAEGRNRYKDVGCLESTRVVLTLGPVPYIHANYVKTTTDEKKFICTQAPMKKTLAEFWYLVVQEKCTVILMLCNFTEMGSKKCEEYYPLEAGQTFTEGEITVTSKSKDKLTLELPNNETSKVKMMVSELEVVIADGPPHACKHYHWQDWPDRGVPEACLFPYALLNKWKKFEAPIVVHCSAGIGRTGSIVLIDHALDTLRRGDTLPEMKQYLLDLRAQRNNSIQTEQQYLYVHQILFKVFTALGYLGGYEELLAKFTKDYTKATAGF